MSREIKFRAYWYKTKLITLVDTIAFVNGGTHVSDGCSDMGWVGKDCEVMQYTGLKDKNGNEIYEWDKCEVFRPCIYAKGFIKFHQGSFIFEEFKTGNILRLCDLQLNNYEILVISNIYQNPELVEVK